MPDSKGRWEDKDLIAFYKDEHRDNIAIDATIWTTELVDDLVHKVEQFGLDLSSTKHPFFANDISIRRGNTSFQYTDAEMDEFKRCKKDIIYFANKYVKVMQEHGIDNITLYEYQEDMLRNYQAERYNIVVGSRQIGKTVVAGIFLVWYLIFHYDKNIMLAGNKGMTAKEILDKAKMVIQNLPFFLKPAMTVWNQFSIASDANSRILATTTTDKAAIGFTIHLLFLDEFAHVRQNIQRSFYDNIYPVVSAGKNTKIILTSTPNGYDLFQEIFDKSMKGKNEYISMEIPWWKVPGRDEDWAAGQIANMGEEAFNEQFNCSFLRNDTLLLSGAQLRLVDSTKQKFVHHEMPLLADYMLDYEGLDWVEDFDLESVRNESSYFFLSIDLAEGVGRDYTVMQIFQLVPKNEEQMKELSSERFEMYKFFKMKQVGIFRRNDMPIDDFCKICYVLFYSNKFFDLDRTKVMLEWNTYGSFFVEKIKNLFSGADYDESIFVRSYHRKGARARKIGIRQDKESKPRNCVELKSRIDKRDIEITEPWTAKELGFFSRNKKGSYEAVTGHDDTVMACVNLMEAYRSIEYADLISECFDRQSAEVREKVLEIMGGGTGFDESTDFLVDDNGFGSMFGNNDDSLSFI